MLSPISISSCSILTPLTPASTNIFVNPEETKIQFPLLPLAKLQIFII